MLNAIGLQNVGVDAFLAEKLPELARLGATVIANVWGDTEDDYVAVVERIGDDRRVAAIELNVSCPNVVKGGMIFGNDPDALAAPRDAASAPRRASRSSSSSRRTSTDIVATARAAVDAGADALSLINTLVGLAIDLERREPKIGFTTRRALGPGDPPDRRADGLGGPEGAAEDPDLRDGRHRDGRARRRVPPRRRERRPGRHRELPRPRRSRAASSESSRAGASGTASRASPTSSGR